MLVDGTWGKLLDTDRVSRAAGRWPDLHQEVDRVTEDRVDRSWVRRMRRWASWPPPRSSAPSTAPPPQRKPSQWLENVTVNRMSPDDGTLFSLLFCGINERNTGSASAAAAKSVNCNLHRNGTSVKTVKPTFTSVSWIKSVFYSSSLLFVVLLLESTVSQNTATSHITADDSHRAEWRRTAAPPLSITLFFQTVSITSARQNPETHLCEPTLCNFR